MILGRFKISGHSMLPLYGPGDQVITWGLSKIHEGDVVVLKYNSKYVVKRVKKIFSNKYFLEGDNVHDSLSIPPIQKSAIIGKVLFKL